MDGTIRNRTHPLHNIQPTNLQIMALRLRVLPCLYLQAISPGSNLHTWLANWRSNQKKLESVPPSPENDDWILVSISTRNHRKPLHLGRLAC